MTAAWKRILVIEALQLPFVMLLIWGRPPMSLWLAGLVGSAICCYGTDSHWRWLNRALVAQAILWLCIPLIFTELV